MPGTHQEQVEAQISYPIPLCVGENIKPYYKTEVETETPKAPCLGEPDEPIATGGYLCIYTGGAQGALESEWNNASFAFTSDLIGTEKVTKAQQTLGNTIGGSNFGVLVTFRTNEFSTTSPITSLKQPANLNAIGSWAVKALK